MGGRFGVGGIEKVIHCMPYINQTLLIIQYFIHYTKGDAVTEELYITLYIITDSTGHNKMHFILLQIVQDTTRCVENEEMRGTPH